MRCEETCGLVIILDRMLIPSTSAVPNYMHAIKNFHLKYHSDCEFEGRLFSISWIYKWISNVVMRKVEEVTLSVGKSFMLPLCLFTCETLTMLKIEMGGDLPSKMKKSGTFDFPQSFSLPRLKVLHLTHMVFVDESAQLFSNCPVLEELGLTHCYMMKTNVLHISVASLQRLFSTNSKKYSCKLKIHTPTLQSLTYSGIPEDYDEMDHGFSYLLSADINIVFEFLSEKTKGKKARQCGLKNLLEGVSNVEFLTISGDTLESLYFEEITPSFHNLRRLEVSSKCKRAGAWALLDLLPFLPNLESLVITPGFQPYPEHRDFQDRMAPECVLLKLKAVEFWSLFCQQVELNIIKFFLANSLECDTCVLPNFMARQEGQIYEDSTNVPESQYKKCDQFPVVSHFEKLCGLFLLLPLF